MGNLTKQYCSKCGRRISWRNTSKVCGKCVERLSKFFCTNFKPESCPAYTDGKCMGLSIDVCCWSKSEG